jgi:hypothetical protein
MVATEIDPAVPLLLFPATFAYEPNARGAVVLLREIYPELRRRGLRARSSSPARLLLPRCSERQRSILVSSSLEK